MGIFCYIPTFLASPDFLSRQSSVNNQANMHLSSHRLAVLAFTSIIMSSMITSSHAAPLTDHIVPEGSPSLVEAPLSLVEAPLICPVGYEAIENGLGGDDYELAMPHPDPSRSMPGCGHVCDTRTGCTGLAVPSGRTNMIGGPKWSHDWSTRIVTMSRIEQLQEGGEKTHFLRCS